MKVNVEPGKYIVAVSGGVDSVVLLHLLSQMQASVISSLDLVKNSKTRSQKPDHANSLELVVAHFDHGIRHDSADDSKFVAELAKKYGLKFEHKAEKLGQDASEELARNRRYKFLESVIKKHDAMAIITAHHSGDVLETAIFNLLRGTGRGGLTSLKSTDKIVRPLLNYKKSDILKYAKQNSLEWREDPTNKSLIYTRNRVRKFLFEVPTSSKEKLDEIIGKSTARNLEMDELVQGIFDYGYDKQKQSFDRQFFVSLPHKIATELLVYWLKQLGAKYDKKLVEKLVNDLKTLPLGAKTDVGKNLYFELGSKQISMTRRTSV